LQDAPALPTNNVLPEYQICYPTENEGDGEVRIGNRRENREKMLVSHFPILKHGTEFGGFPVPCVYPLSACPVRRKESLTVRRDR
jgi:hypothetical protein